VQRICKAQYIARCPSVIPSASIKSIQQNASSSNQSWTLVFTYRRIDDEFLTWSPRRHQIHVEYETFAIFDQCCYIIIIIIIIIIIWRQLLLTAEIGFWQFRSVRAGWGWPTRQFAFPCAFSTASVSSCGAVADAQRLRGFHLQAGPQWNSQAPSSQRHHCPGHHLGRNTSHQGTRRPYQMWRQAASRLASLLNHITLILRSLYWLRITERIECFLIFIIFSLLCRALD